MRERFADAVISTHSRLGDDTVVIANSKILEVARFLKEDPELAFDLMIDLTAVDHWKNKPRFEVVMHLQSLEKNHRLRVKVPVEGSDPTIETVSSVWPAANWYEREVYDMFGIVFKGHPDLRRILMYPEFEGHPLRKDYPITKRQPLVGPKD
ncbi:MAG: NADH-quinone oxidoreductase subunit C [Acidobacteriota bacterium]|nr:MAG: NADH-quinone oxidoreductase subunit C [Acidobacteriota bacterium]